MSDQWSESPRPDELLSAYLLRQARASGFRPHRFMKRLCGDEAVWDRDIDRSASDRLLQTIAVASGLPLSRVEAMTLRPWERALRGDRMSSGPPTAGIAPWILCLGIYGRNRRAFGMQVCPACLAEGTSFRRQWRLASETTCVRHGTLFIDRCPECRTPIMPYRLDPDLQRCHACGRRISTRPAPIGAEDHAKPLEPVDATTRSAGAGVSGVAGTSLSSSARIPDLLQLGLRMGCVPLGGCTVSLRAWASGVRLLIACLHERIPRHLWGDDPDWGVTGNVHIQFEQIAPGARHHALGLLARLLDQWPTRFQESATAWGLTQCVVPRAKRACVPTWLEDGLRGLPPGRPWSTRLNPTSAPDQQRAHTAFRRQLRNLHRRREPGWRSARATLLLQAAERKR